MTQNNGAYCYGCADLFHVERDIVTARFADVVPTVAKNQPNNREFPYCFQELENNQGNSAWPFPVNYRY